MRIGIFESKLSISRIVAERNSTFQIILKYLTRWECEVRPSIKLICAQKFQMGQWEAWLASKEEEAQVALLNQA